jgi:ABC-type cobalt transport system substrate-binding protein
MRTKIILIILLLILAAMLISLNYFQSSTGPHQGTVKKAGEYNIEVKNSYTNFYAYLLDKKSKPISNKGISCEVKFVFGDHTGISIPLIPYKDDGFTTEDVVPEFYSCSVNFNVMGKLISAKFENENTIAQKNK